MPITGGFVSRNQREKIFKSGTLLMVVDFLYSI